MISTLITRGTEEERKEKALDLCEKQEIHVLDRQIFSPNLTDEKGTADEKFGISMVRTIKQRAMLKPAYSEQNAVIILESQLLTLPAQQALLKLLEEPPEHTSIIMTADNEESLLPTICSRCKILYAEESLQEVSKSTDTAAELFHEGSMIKDRLELAETIAQDHPEEWVKKYILVTRLYMLQNVKDNNVPFARKASRSLTAAQEAYQKLIMTNGNPRLIIEHLLLGM